MHRYSSKKLSPADGYNVIDTKGFDKALQSIRNAIEEYKKARNVIDTEGEALRSTWEGAGGEQFAKVFQELQSNMIDDIETLQEIHDRLENGKLLYEQGDEFGSEALDATCNSILSD